MKAAARRPNKRLHLTAYAEMHAHYTERRKQA